MSDFSKTARLLCFSLLVAVAACTGDEAPKEPSAPSSAVPSTAGDITLHSETRLQPWLPLMVKVEPGTRLYANSMLAIDVVEVEADGRPVAARPSMVLFVGIDTSTRVIAGDYYVYETGLADMLFWRTSLTGEPNLIEYLIPAEAEKVEITYRLIDGDGHPRPQTYRLMASRNG